MQLLLVPLHKIMKTPGGEDGSSEEAGGQEGTRKEAHSEEGGSGQEACDQEACN